MRAIFLKAFSGMNEKAKIGLGNAARAGMPVCRSKSGIAYLPFIFLAIWLLAVIASVIAPHALSWLPALGVAAAFLLAPRQILGQVSDTDKLPMMIAAIFLAWALISCLWASNVGLGVSSVFRAAGSLAIVYGCLLIGRAMAPLNRAERAALLVGHAALMALLLLLFFGLVSLVPIRGERADINLTSWVFNRAAVFSVLLMPAIYTIFNGLFPQKSRISAILIWAGLSLLIVMLSASETAKLAILFVLPFSLLIASSLRAAAIALTIGFGTTLFILPHVMAKHGLKILSFPISNYNTSTFAGRIEIWTYVAKFARSAPVFGHGVEASRTLEYTSIIRETTLIAHHPHSIIFQLWVDLGFVGAFLFFIFIALVLRNISRDLENIGKIQIATVGIALVVASVSHGMWQNWWFGMVAVAFMVTRACAPQANMPDFAAAPHRANQ